SASPLRKAWLDASHNYWTLEGVTYAAIRIPSPPKDLRVPRAEALERGALAAVRGVASRETTVEGALDALEAYHALVRPSKPFMRDHYERALEERPWERCPCAVCREAGAEVIIFRGNNRNRRRGFHN